MAPKPQALSGKVPWLVRVLAAGAMVLAVSVLVGWASNNPLLELRLSGRVAMMPNAALGMALVALALLSVVFEPPPSSRWRKWAAFGCAVAAAAIGAATLVEYLLQADLRIDELLIRVPDADAGPLYRGRMAPQAAAGLVLLGSALGCMVWRRLARAAQVLAIVATLIGVFNLIGFVYGSEAFYRIGALTPIALAAAAGLVALGLAAMFARPEVGLTRSFTSDTPGIHIINWLLVATLTLPLALDWMVSRGEIAGLYGRPSGEAFSAVMGSIILMILIWRAGRNLIHANEQLEHRVRIRTAQLENANLELTREIAERKQAQEALAESELRLRTVFEEAPVAISISRDAVGLYANRKCMQMFGLRSAAEWVDRHVFDNFAPHFQDEIKERTRRRALGLPVPAEFESVGLRTDGSQFPVEITAAEIQLANGPAVIAFVTDITERMQAETRMRLQSSALESAGNAIVITNTNGVIEWANSSFTTLTKYNASEAIGHSPRELVRSGEQGGAFYKELWTTILAGKIWRGELVNRRKDGSTYAEYMTITPVQDVTGKITHFIAIKEDITERKRAETRIKYLNRIYAVLSDINQCIVRERDMVRLYEAVCRIAIEQGGFVLAWIGLVDRASSSLKVATHAGATEGFIEKVSRAFAENLPENAAFAEVWRAGTRLICNDLENDPRMAHLRDISVRLGFRSLASIPLHKGAEVIGTLNLIAGEDEFFDDEELLLLEELALDISFAGEVHEHESIRRQIEAHTREQAQAMDLAPVAITIYDAAGVVTYCNNVSATLYGFKNRKEMMGLRTEDIFPSEALKVFEPGLALVQAAGTWEGEPSFRTRDGRQVVTSHHISLLYDEAGRPKGRLSIATDITEKRKLEEQVLRAQRLENLGMLAAGIAHDFNNALAPITMAGPLLRQQLHDPTGLRMLDIVEQSSARGAALVRQMLSFARGTSEGRQLIQLRHVLREVAELSQSSFPKSIIIEANLSNDLWPIQADPTQMNQVFLNLCVNARDAMPEGGEITISAENRVLDVAEASKIHDGRAGDFLMVEVRDNGTGIPSQVLERIFDPFFTTKGEGKGTGLGLSTVRAIVSNHDGFMVVHTSTGKDRGHGTVFTIYLPAAAGETAEISPTHRTPTGRGRGELILFVDDEQPVLDVGVKILIERGGYQVITARNGADAAAAFVPRASEVRLLVTDLDMPQVDGRSLALALRVIKPSLPVIVMTGGSLETDEKLKAFATAFLQKPFEVQSLLEIVHRTLKNAASGSPFPPKA